MKSLAAAEAKTNFGHLLDMAQRSPVTIEKRGRAVAVVVSLQDFQHYEELEDKVWALEAEKANKEGYLSSKKSEDFLASLG